MCDFTHCLVSYGSDYLCIVCAYKSLPYFSYNVVSLPWLLLNSPPHTHTHNTHTLTEQQRDKRIAREDEFSDSEDEGEGGRRNEQLYHEPKKPKIGDDQRSSLLKSVTNNQGAVSSPVPPEPSPITPLPEEENIQASKGVCEGGGVEEGGGEEGGGEERGGEGGGGEEGRGGGGGREGREGGGGGDGVRTPFTDLHIH